jgi:hypothetical protein
VTLVRVPVACLAAALLAAVAGCGGSSKPAYCSDRSDLQSSVKGLSNLTVSSGVSGLKTQLTTIQSDANKVVSSAKSDFPSQTDAITTSVDTLQTAVQAVPSSPTAKQFAPVAAAAAGVVSSVKSFMDATNSKCG